MNNTVAFFKHGEMSDSEAYGGVAGQRTGASSYCVELDHSLLTSRCCLTSSPHTRVAAQIIVAQLRIIADSIGLAAGKQRKGGEASWKGRKGRELPRGQKGRGARQGKWPKGRESQEGGRGRELGRLRGAREGGVSSGARVVQERGLDLRPKLLLRVSLVLCLPSFHALTSPPALPSTST